MPAIRAAPNTSPFLALPLRTMASVFAHDHAAFGDGDAFGRGLARDIDHAGFTAAAEMGEPVRRGTLHRSAAAARCARQQRARRSCHIVLPHQALADEEASNPDRGEARQIGRRKDSAFANDDRSARNQRRQPLAGGERGLECLEIAIVDADELAI